MRRPTRLGILLIYLFSYHVYLSIYLYILSVYRHITSLSICWCEEANQALDPSYLSIFLSCLSIYLSIFISCLSIYFIYLSISEEANQAPDPSYLSIFLSCLSIYLYILSVYLHITSLSICRCEEAGCCKVVYACEEDLGKPGSGPFILMNQHAADKHRHR